VLGERDRRKSTGASILSSIYYDNRMLSIHPGKRPLHHAGSISSASRPRQCRVLEEESI
jgi:hypothetical protein